MLSISMFARVIFIRHQYYCMCFVSSLTVSYDRDLFYYMLEFSLPLLGKVMDFYPCSVSVEIVFFYTCFERTFGVNGTGSFTYCPVAVYVVTVPVAM